MADQKTATGITLHCPLCGEPGACVSLRLNDLDFDCQECGDTFDRAAVAELVKELQGRVSRWNAVLAWADQMPSGE